MSKIVYFDFSIEKNRKEIEDIMKKIAKDDGKIISPVIWKHENFGSREEAKQFIENRLECQERDSFYGQFAVRYRTTNFVPSIKLQLLKEKVEEEGVKISKSYFNDFKGEFIKCSHCKSTLAANEKVKSTNTCLVCGESVISLKGKQNIENNYSLLKKEIYKLEREERVKHIKEAEEYWLIKIEY